MTPSGPTGPPYNGIRLLLSVGAGVPTGPRRVQEAAPYKKAFPLQGGKAWAGGQRPPLRRRVRDAAPYGWMCVTV